MQTLRSYPVASALLLLSFFATSAPVAAVQSTPVDEMALAFATCQGRYSAMRGTQNYDGQRVQTDVGLSHFSDLFDAVAFDRERAERGALNETRRRAQSEMSRLISVAHFANDPRRMKMARKMIAQRLRACESLILS